MQHLFEEKLYALVMTYFLHFRKVQLVGYGSDMPIPLTNVRGLIKNRDIVQSSLLGGRTEETLCFFTVLARAEYLMCSLVGDSENNGDVCDTKSTLVPQTAKVTSTPGFLKLVVCYT